MNPIAIGIAGGSCSGKSTLTEKLYSKLGPDKAVVLPQDDYFFGLGDAPPGKGGPNFDHPDAVDFDNLCTQLADLKAGQSIDRPLYDFPTHLPKAETEHTVSQPVILVDGILILHHQPMRELLDLKIFVECDATTRFTRRLDRDVKERGRTSDSVRTVFTEQVSPMHEKYVEPSKRHADIVVNSQQSGPGFEGHFDIIIDHIEALSR